MKKNMITRFFFLFAHVVSIKHLLPPHFELIQSQNLDPSCLPSKEADSNKGPRVPDHTMRERIRFPTSQGGVERLNRKITTLYINPLHWILRLHRKRMVMQPLKEVVYLIQLPIIQLSNKPRILATTIPNINHPSIFRGSYRKKVLGSRPQQHSNLETHSNFEILPTISDCLPNSHILALKSSQPFLIAFQTPTLYLSHPKEL